MPGRMGARDLGSGGVGARYGGDKPILNQYNQRG